MLKITSLNIIYKIGIQLASLIVPIVGLFNKKIKKGVKGRNKTLNYLNRNIKKGDSVFWFHCASLGEYEQGLPVFKSLKESYPDAKIILSFLSPSGYEIRKENPITPHVVYIPLDTPKNVRSFLKIMSPKLVIFIKYEIWPNYLNALKNHPAKVYLVSALFRSKQIYFRSQIKFFRKILWGFDHIFTQNLDSKKLLESIGYKSVTVSKDTRFDRVSNQLEKNNVLPIIEKFKGSNLCLVAGSTWSEDIEIMWQMINRSQKKLKFIIAPHKIDNEEISILRKKLGKKAELYSNKELVNIENKQILIIDCIGILTKLYSYADIAYVGGGMGKSGLHNTLEAAVFSVPIIIGRNYSKFPEAIELINNGGMVSVNDAISFESTVNKYVQDKEYREKSGKSNKAFVDLNKGASSKIIKKIKADLKD